MSKTPNKNKFSKAEITNLTLNRRKAVHERCLNCSGWIPSEVRNCSHQNCPFYPYRTGKGSQNATARKKSIKNYCLDCMNGQVGEVTKCSSFDCPLYVFRRGHRECIEKEIISKKRISFRQLHREQRL